MYRCTRDAEHETFTRAVPATVIRTLDAEGQIDHGAERRIVHNHEAEAVRCATAGCEALAEWLDARQGELFALAPTLCEA